MGSIVLAPAGTLERHPARLDPGQGGYSRFRPYSALGDAQATSSSFAHAFHAFPTFLKLRLGFLQGRHAVRSCHRTVGVHGPEPAQTIGAAARFVDTTDLPLASKDGVIRAVLVDPGAEAGRAHGEQSAKPVFDDGRRSDRSGYGRNDREPQHPPIAPFLLPQIHSFLFGQPGLRIDGLVFVGNSPYQITPREFHPLPLKFRSVRRKCHLQSPVLIPTNACPSPLLRFVASAWDSFRLRASTSMWRNCPTRSGSYGRAMPCSAFSSSNSIWRIAVSVSRFAIIVPILLLLPIHCPVLCGSTFVSLGVLRGLSDRRASRRTTPLTASMLLPFRSGRRSKISASSALATIAL